MAPTGRPATLDRRPANARAYAGEAGKVYQIALPPSLTAGRYRIVVEVALGRTTVAREITFSVLARMASAADDVPFTAMAVTGSSATGAGAPP